MTIRPADIRPDAFASAPPTKANIPQFSHRFDLGAIAVSPQALRALQRFGTDPSTRVQRHASDIVTVRQTTGHLLRCRVSALIAWSARR